MEEDPRGSSSFYADFDKMPDLTAQRNLFFLNSSISFGICDLKDTAAVIKDVRGTKQTHAGLPGP